MPGELGRGAVVAGYRIEEFAGRGGQGVVYRASDVRLGRQVALKLIAPEWAADEQFRERFIRESRLAAQIDHPHIVPIYYAGDHEGQPFIAMRWVPGPDLGALLGRDGPLAPGRAVDLIAQIASALDAAHAEGLVHRDVKPANVLIAGGGEGEHAYLTDFGLTKLASSESALTRTGFWIGTAAYAAPEQIQAQPVDARTDVYSLGCIAFELLTGHQPFRRDHEVATLFAHVHDPLPPLRQYAPHVPEQMAWAIERATAKRADDRQPSAGAFAAELAAQPRRPAQETRPRPLPPPAPPPPSRPPVGLWQVVIVIVLVLLAVFVVAGLEGWLTPSES
jgi:serine/threonine protein kinase